MKRALLAVATFFAVLVALVPTASAAPKFKVLHAFGNGQDGAGTWGSLLLDKKGNVYGTTSGGGLYGYGTVFELTPKSNGKWSEIILHSFDLNGQDGFESHGSLTFAAGNLFGTTTGGGAYNYGTVFELTPGSGGWAETVLYSFGSHQNDGFEPYAGVVLGPAGDLFGTTPHDPGNVFELTPGSDGWTESVIDDFSKHDDGNGPFAGLIVDAAGNLYGTTEYGGVHNLGVVYSLKSAGDGSWKERILHDFCAKGPPNCQDGARPGVGALTMDISGNVYGTTAGGDCCGTVFRLTQANGRWKETILYDFKGGASGYEPGAGVVRDTAGNLYGTTVYGGSCCGVVFKLSPKENGKWKYTLLHTFTGYDGAQPDANLILDEKGNLYGTAATGGAYDDGVVFEVTR